MCDSSVRKLLVLAVITAMLLCGCSTGNVSKNSENIENSVSVILPDAETATTVNGYLLDDPSSSVSTTKTEYYANKNSKKFHLSTCHWATSIKEENLYKSFNRELLISDGYEPCKTCKP